MWSICRSPGYVSSGQDLIPWLPSAILKSSLRKTKMEGSICLATLSSVRPCFSVKHWELLLKIVFPWSFVTAVINCWTSYFCVMLISGRSCLPTGSVRELRSSSFSSRSRTSSILRLHSASKTTSIVVSWVVGLTFWSNKSAPRPYHHYSCTNSNGNNGLSPAR